MQKKFSQKKSSWQKFSGKKSSQQKSSQYKSSWKKSFDRNLIDSNNPLNRNLLNINLLERNPLTEILLTAIFTTELFLTFWYSHLSNKREVRFIDFIFFPPSMLIDFLDFFHPPLLVYNSFYLVSSKKYHPSLRLLIQELNWIHIMVANFSLPHSSCSWACCLCSIKNVLHLAVQAILQLPMYIIGHEGKQKRSIVFGAGRLLCCTGETIFGSSPLIPLLIILCKTSSEK